MNNAVVVKSLHLLLVLCLVVGTLNRGREIKRLTDLECFPTLGFEVLNDLGALGMLDVDSS